MSARMASWGRCMVLAGAVSLLGLTLAQAGEKPTVRTKSAKVDAQHRNVELFAGVKSGDLEVRYIPRDDKSGRVYITNHSTEPLNVQLPATFAARPVLAQLPPGWPNMTSNNQRPAQSPQVTSGPFPNMFPSQNNNSTSFGNGQGGGGGNTFFQGGVFSIPANQVGEIRVSTVCLEHGNPDPKPQIPYELVSLDSVSSDPLLAAVIEKMGQGDYTQREAQAAAWHLANDMSWETLGREPGAMIALGEYRPYFSKQELKQAQKLIEEAEALVKAKAESKDKPDTAPPKL